MGDLSTSRCWTAPHEEPDDERHDRHDPERDHRPHRRHDPARPDDRELLGRRRPGRGRLVRRGVRRRPVLRHAARAAPAAYVEFRVGDYQHELGIIDRRYAPGAATQPGGAVVYWHVDDVRATYERLLALGGTEYQPVTPQGDGGFVTAAVVDPFGNVLGVMENPHYLAVLEGREGEDISPRSTD
ncbi:VOC family protein [Oerskovia sp. M15]